MWLINTHSLELREFLGNQVPKYAALSHTWGDEEMSFHEWTNPGSSTRDKAGAVKIRGACDLARGAGLEWLWADTCCIDKSSSAELTEAINSMFAWYRDSRECYAYLEDVPAAGPDVGDAFRRSRWMTRGWTLQELLAPPKVVFYARDWSRLGSRSGHLIDDVVAATGIEKQYLLGTPIRKASVSNRMSWVAKRETTRTEDIAYCLLGIFDINMPLLYGEGIKAFSRLQQEIVKVSTDHTIFCWTWNENVPPGWLSMLAPSPDTFADAGDFRRVLPPDDVRPYSMNNVGLAMELPVIYSWTYVFAVLDAAKGREMRPERACVPLRRVAHLDQLDRLPFPSQPVHLVPPRNLGESAQRYVDRSTTYQPVPRQHLTVRSLPKVSGGIAQVALGARFKATHNVLLLLNPFSPPLRIGEKQAPSLTRQKSWSNAIFLHAYDSPAETVDLEMSMIALQRRSLGGREVNAAVMRLGYWDQQHYDVLVAVRPELEGDAAWYCKVLPSRSSNHAPDYTYESDLLPFLNSREPRTRDVSHDGEFGIAIGEDLTLAEGINARAVYIAGSKPRFSTDG